MRTLRPTIPHLFLCGFMLVAGAAVALGLRSSVVAALLALPIAAAFIEISVPAVVLAGANWIARIGAAGIVVAGLLVTLYPVLPEPLVFGVTRVVGHVLALLAFVLLLGRTPTGRGAVPAIMAALIAAFLPPEPAWLRGTTAFALVFLVAWLATSDDERDVPVSPRPLPLALFTLVSAGIAVAIVVILPWAQPQVEVALARMISNDLDATTGLATESRLGDVERLALSKRVTLRFYGDRPVDLRVRTFTRFDGRAWKADPRPARRLNPSEVPQGRWPTFDDTPGTVLGVPRDAIGAGLLPARVVARSALRGAMPAPAHSVAVKVEDVIVDQNPSGILIPHSPASLYAVLYAGGDVGEGPLGAEMLEVPANLDPRLRELAASLAPSDLPAADRIERVLGHFQAGYRYSLDVGAFKTRDPVAEFVFEKKKGYCEYFATASTLLLRLTGVPARYVTGLAVRPFQRSGTHYVVRESDAHAWAEAFVPGRGWVEVDATPAADYEALHGGVDNRGVIARIQALYDELAARFAQAGLRGLLLGLAREAAAHPYSLAALIAAFLAYRFRLRFARGRSAPLKAPTAQILDDLSPQMRGLLRDVDAFCAARGASRSRSRAPREHVADPGVSMDERERSVCLRAIDALYAHAYGGQPVDPRELSALVDGVAALGTTAWRK